MFIRDYSLNVMIDCNDRFFYTGFALFGRDWEAMATWCLEA
jgi:hypothetical protein